MQNLSPEAKLVQQALMTQGLENPQLKGILPSNHQEQIQEKFAEILTLLGLDLHDASLKESPKRIAKMFSHELFYGLDYANFPEITKLPNSMQLSEMVQVKDIQLISTCEHHFLTIYGTVSVAYLPKNWIIGLSKINRIVDFFAKRPQVQERLTQQILVAIQTLLETEDVAIQIQATHLCVKVRGIKDQSSQTLTSAFGGKFLSPPNWRAEFLKNSAN